MPESVTIDGRGNTIQEAINEMWSRMQPLEQRGFYPTSEVEIVDTSKKEIIQTFQLTDPEFQFHLKSDQKQKSGEAEPKRKRLHVPESKEHVSYIARIRLQA